MRRHVAVYEARYAFGHISLLSRPQAMGNFSHDGGGPVFWPLEQRSHRQTQEIFEVSDECRKVYASNRDMPEIGPDRHFRPYSRYRFMTISASTASTY